MHFVARIDVHLPSDIIEQAPTAWQRFKSLWGAARTSAMARDEMEAATFVYECRTVFDALGIDNARSLVVDGTTVFHDARNTKGDLPDLLLALADHVAVFGTSCRELRLSVVHEEAGLDLVLDATVTSEHGKDDPSARLTVVGRVCELEAQREESPAAYRARIERFTTDTKALTAARLQFAAFVARLESELARALPTSRFRTITEALNVAELWPSTAAPAATTPSDARSVEDTAAPQRNFTISLEQRISALMTGPPAYAVRLRKIEDLEQEIATALRKNDRPSHVPVAVVRQLEQLQKLIGEHNRYYPIECNLPADLATGNFLDRGGEPWRPRPVPTLDELRRRA